MCCVVSKGNIKITGAVTLVCSSIFQKVLCVPNFAFKLSNFCESCCKCERASGPCCQRERACSNMADERSLPAQHGGAHRCLEHMADSPVAKLTPQHQLLTSMTASTEGKAYFSNVFLCNKFQYFEPSFLCLNVLYCCQRVGNFSINQW